MARQTPPQRPRSASLSPQQLKQAIPKLERRITELKAIDVAAVRRRGEPQFEAIETKIDATLMEIFGSDTIDYERYKIRDLDTASINMMHETSISAVIEGYRRGITNAISNLQTAIDIIKENLQDLGETPDGRAGRAFDELDIHPGIKGAVGKLFRDGHYSNAIEDACKALNKMVQTRSGRPDLTGTSLMQQVFSPKVPVLRFNKLQTESDRDEQQGLMFLYAGAMLALRNPRAHELIRDDSEQSLEYVGFLSLLAKLLDRAERV
jgi:uncharacterized protein (TIGR02391 family)